MFTESFGCAWEPTQQHTSHPKDTHTPTPRAPQNIRRTNDLYNSPSQLTNTTHLCQAHCHALHEPHGMPCARERAQAPPSTITSCISCTDGSAQRPSTPFLALLAGTATWACTKYVCRCCGCGGVGVWEGGCGWVRACGWEVGWVGVSVSVCMEIGVYRDV
jgi:hypothetical protein